MLYFTKGRGIFNEWTLILMNGSYTYPLGLKKVHLGIWHEQCSIRILFPGTDFCGFGGRGQRAQNHKFSGGGGYLIAPEGTSLSDHPLNSNLNMSEKNSHIGQDILSLRFTMLEYERYFNHVRV